MFKALGFAVLFGLFLTGLNICYAQSDRVSAEAKESTDPTIHQYKNLFIAGEPSATTLERFKKENRGAVVIDLRSITELGNCEQPANAAKLGMQYQKINFEKSETIDAKVIADIEERVDQAGHKPVLVFCKTGNRASAWLAIHLMKKEHMAVDEALRFAKDFGLRDEMAAKVRAFSVSRP
jgi:protein tyrosine phosphatase (PTP) superfamily phosphohydrolase (DUF442 family)